MKISSRFALFVSTLVLCLNTVPLFASTQITIKAIGSNAEKVYIISSGMISGRDTLAKTNLNAVGNAEFTLRLTTPVFAFIRIGKKSEKVYLQPNTNTEINVDLKKEHRIFVYRGKTAEVNNYLAQSSQIVTDHLIINGKYINEFEPEEFAVRLDSMDKALAYFHRKYMAKTSLSGEMQDFLRISARMYPLSLKQNYSTARFYTPTEKVAVPPALQKVFGEVPFNDALLLAKDEAYATVLLYYLTDITYQIYYNILPEERKNSIILLPKLKDAAIKKGTYSPAVKEFLLAQNVYEAFDYGINEVATSLYNEFMTGYPSSFYLSSIDKRYRKWLTLSKGTLAPNFVGITPDGQKLSLNDLKGKVVYTDIWATWCGPCREELPKSKEIQKQFSQNDKVVFLYVSIDTDTESWKKFLKSDPAFVGTHINISNSDQVSNLYKTYQMVGVPTYLLIDQEGKISAAPAPRPSSGKVENEIKALLK
ncbi:TlpA family protein disulfide reductase [Runella sp.]|uniref:TlpA family protein disulfide reductase n=1 Tax=Runella sp. TaxID=1960881 RepID=UPI003D13455F